MGGNKTGGNKTLWKKFIEDLERRVRESPSPDKMMTRGCMCREGHTVSLRSLLEAARNRTPCGMQLFQAFKRLRLSLVDYETERREFEAEHADLFKK